jgi:hypothetical protein
MLPEEPLIRRSENPPATVSRSECGQGLGALGSCHLLSAIAPGLSRTHRPAARTAQAGRLTPLQAFALPTGDHSASDEFALAFTYEREDKTNFHQDDK